ncbi:ABC transporter ATP-binding protein [Paenibacillus sp. y28]|uniref:ABC transporter ATP-binding protein n=1 Tax=Paenibacillus sp. y28 TaxID=3129110 RepID=UPI00301AA66B
MSPTLEVKNLTISFQQYRGGWRQSAASPIQGLDISVQDGEVLAVVGASGSGKSLLAHAILGILPRHAAVTGAMRFRGQELTADRLEQLRGKDIVLVPQSVNFLDPLMRVGAQVRLSVRDGSAVEKQRQAFARYGLARNVENHYPFQLSGGMARRVLVSTATVSGAGLIIADEPTPGLDAESLREALRCFRELADQGNAVLLITHDLESALDIADRVAVFYAGTTVESAPASDFRSGGERLRHPYTRALWHALPQNGFTPLPGAQPDPDNLPHGCLFAPRCAMATAECGIERPVLRELRGGTVRCIHAS